MDEHKKIRVTINQDQDSNSKRHDLEYFLTPKQKKQNQFMKGPNKRLMNKLLKPIAFAILLGVIFGIGFISFFSDLTPTTNNDATPVFNEDTEDDDGTEENTDHTLENGSLFEKNNRSLEVVQYGIFSTIENARELAQSLAQSTVPALVYEENDQYYVLSIVNIESYDRENVTSWLESLGYEYMNDFLYKDWNFSALSIEGSDDEVNWLEEGYQLIDQSSLSRDEISEWVDSAPDKYANDPLLIAVDELVNQYEQQIAENSLQIYSNTTKLGLLLFFEKQS